MTRRRPGDPRVLIVQEWIPDYRVALFERLREALAADSIALTVAAGEPPADVRARDDGATLAGGLVRRNRAIAVAGRSLVWQPWTDVARSHDLVISTQASRLLLNYHLLARQALRCARAALWGHGANLQARRSDALAEAVKRRISRLPHWWFAYTESTRRRLVQLGYPEDRLTVVQNAVCTDSLRRAVEDARRAREAIRRSLDLGRGPVGLFIGSLYDVKGLDFLVSAADAAVRANPDFRLVVAGTGPLAVELERSARDRPHVRLVGRVTGADKAAVMAAADVLLLPKGAGLAILDGFAAGLPLVTTDAEGHGPEIDYLEPGRNGVVVAASGGPSEYAQAVLALLSDEYMLAKLRAGAHEAARRYSLGEMVARFADGIRAALDSEPR